MSSIDPGAGVTPVASPATPGSGVPASPADGSVAASPSASPESVGLRQLREQYETTKSKLEPWERLGAKPEDVSRSHQTYTKLFTEANTLGQQAGYGAQEVLEAFQQDPVNTLAVLRQKVREAQGNTDQPLTRAEAERIADQRAKKLIEPFHQERETRLDKEAESRFDGEFDRQFKTSFPNGLPDSNKEALQGLAWQLVIDNKDAYNAMRGNGDVSAVTNAFEQAKKMLLKIVADYGEHQKTRISTPPQQSRQPSQKAASIDDIINNLGNPNVPMEQVFNGR